MLKTMIAVPSIRTAGIEMGEQLCWLAATWKWSAPGMRDLLDGERNRGWHHAVVFGLLGALAGARAVETLGVYFHQAVAGMIGAGVRAVPINHTHGQQILAYLHSDMESLSGQMAERDADRAGSGCPFYEVLCDEQTRLYTRLFRS
jgi:urease accessory protein